MFFSFKFAILIGFHCVYVCVSVCLCVCVCVCVFHNHYGILWPVCVSAVETDVIETSHTHAVAAQPSGFLQGQLNATVASTYFDQRVPVPEETSQVGPPGCGWGWGDTSCMAPLCGDVM